MPCSASTAVPAGHTGSARCGSGRAGVMSMPWFTCGPAATRCRSSVERRQQRQQEKCGEQREGAQVPGAQRRGVVAHAGVLRRRVLTDPGPERNRGETPPLDRIAEVPQRRQAGRLPVAHVAVGRPGIEQQDALHDRCAQGGAQLREVREARDLGPRRSAPGGARPRCRPATGRLARRPVTVSSPWLAIATAGRMRREPLKGTQPRSTSSTAPPERSSGVSTSYPGRPSSCGCRAGTGARRRACRAPPPAGRAAGPSARAFPDR